LATLNEAGNWLTTRTDFLRVELLSKGGGPSNVSVTTWDGASVVCPFDIHYDLAEELVPKADSAVTKSGREDVLLSTSLLRMIFMKKRPRRIRARAKLRERQQHEWREYFDKPRGWHNPLPVQPYHLVL